MQTKTKEEKQELLQLYRQSGMSVRAFAEEFELNLGTFRNWLYKKPAKNIPADDGCSLVEVEALKVKQCMDSQNVRIRKISLDCIKPWNVSNDFASLLVISL